MNAQWLDRDWVAANVRGVGDRELVYEPGSDLYYLGEEPFTGVSLRRWPDGSLAGMSHIRDGLADGVSVGWYRNGQVRAYHDMQAGVCHGWRAEWGPDGDIRTEEYCEHGRPLPARPRQ